jgi:hypothetical protein
VDTKARSNSLDATVENAAVATVVFAAAASFETFASIASELGGIA